MSEMANRSELDRAALAELRKMVGGDLEFLAEMIDTFLAEGSKLVAEMQTAFTTGDATWLRRAAHSLKSNSHTFGALPFAALCQEIEGQAATGRLDDVAPLVEQVAASYPGIIAALAAERPGG
jgi:HPt (histidine-containing phosphotransfer) domain-containing protein